MLANIIDYVLIAVLWIISMAIIVGIGYALLTLVKRVYNKFNKKMQRIMDKFLILFSVLFSALFMIFAFITFEDDDRSLFSYLLRRPDSNLQQNQEFDILGRMYITISGIENDVLHGDAIITIPLPGHYGFTFEGYAPLVGIAIPFSESPRISHFVERPIHNEILSGHLRDGGNFLVYQIQTSYASSEVTIVVKNITFPTFQASVNNNRRSFTIPIVRAIEDVENAYIFSTIAGFTYVSVTSIANVNFVQSDPTSSRGSSENTLIITNNMGIRSDIVIIVEYESVSSVWHVLLILGVITAILQVIMGIKSSKKIINILLFVFSIVLFVFNLWGFLFIIIPNLLYRNEMIIFSAGVIIVFSLAASIVQVSKLIENHRNAKS